FFGKFGYMNFDVPWPVLLLPIVAFLAVVIMAVRAHRLNYLIVFSAIILAFSASLWYSISEGYQAQGRYLFAIIGVAFLLARDTLLKHANVIALTALPTITALSLFR